MWDELEGEDLADESLDLFAIAGVEDEVLAVGDGSALARWDGTQWRTLIERSYSQPNLLATAIVGDRIWAVGARGAIVRAE